MKTLTVAAASALLLAAAITELSSRLWPDNYLALLLLCAVALLLNGLFNARLANSQPALAAADGAASASDIGEDSQPVPAARAAAPAAAKPARKPREQAKPRKAAEPTNDSHSGPRETGTVKWFNRSKGFGFIIRENGDEIFVHQRSVRMTDEGDQRRRPTLRDGQAVTFAVVERDKGAQAEDVADA